MRTICIDLGNTNNKVALFENDKLISYHSKLNNNELLNFIKNENFDEIMASSVTKSAIDIENELHFTKRKISVLTSNTFLPIKKIYDTPETLGSDRLAAAVGAQVIFPNSNCLIIDIGTCIKYDLITKEGAFVGGIIGPGLKMRFKAMHEFTKKLPLLTTPAEWPLLIGKSTKTCMQSGVLNGMLAEINGIIEQYEQELTNFKIIVCGGDAVFFEKRLKKPTFVAPELVMLGLNRIHTHNAQLSKSSY